MQSSRIPARKSAPPTLPIQSSTHWPQARTSAPRTQNRQAPTCFDDLPHEIVCNIAGHAFKAAVHDQQHTVSSLACTPRLRAVLSDELHAGEVLEEIHAARDLPALISAVARVQDVFPRYRQGCLIGALNLMAKLGASGPEADALVSQVQALVLRMPTRQVGPDGNDENPRDAVLLALVEASRLSSFRLVPAKRFESILGMLNPLLPVSPQLEAALVRQVVDHLSNPVNDVNMSQFRQHWLSLAPAALHPRLTKVFDFFESFQKMKASSSAATMARQMETMEGVLAARDPDETWQLRSASRQWYLLARRLPECAALYKAFFTRLDPARQLRLIDWGQSPLKQGEIDQHLQRDIGQAPAKALLRTLARYAFQNSNTEEFHSRTEVLRNIIQSSIDTPQHDEVLAVAISTASIYFGQLRPFLEQAVARATKEMRPALELRLAIAGVGCGDYSSGLAAMRAPVSRMVDGLLDSRRPLDRHAIVALAESHVSWLDERQRGQLIDRIRQLPPADSARCLTLVLSDLAKTRSTSFWPASQLLVNACAALPPQYRAGPVSALLQVASTQHHAEPHRDPTLQQGARRLYDALPATLLPPFDRRNDEVLRAARTQGPV